MATNKIDFKRLNSELLSQAHFLLSQWLPGGRIIGNEYTCGDLSGGEGQSLKININTGLWCDFAADIKGGDLVSLYAAIHGMSQIEAARELEGKAEVSPSSSLNQARSSQQTRKPVELVMPTTPLNKFKHATLGIPSKTWTYYNETGQLCFYISRYETEKGKELRPWSFNADGKWCNKAWPDNRPLFNIHNLRDGKPVLIVEGEKACDAAIKTAGNVYDVVTWSGGAQAINKSDFKPIYGRKILIWPDCDQAGIGAANRIADMLLDQCPEVKVLDVTDLEQNGDDAADFRFTYAQFGAWAKPRVNLYQRPVEPEIEPEPEYNLPAIQGPPPGWDDHNAPMDVIQKDSEHESSIALTMDEIKNIKEAGLSTNKSLTPYCNVYNVTQVLNSPVFKYEFWYDEFHLAIFFKNDKGVVERWSSKFHAVEVAVALQRYFGMHKVSISDVNNGVLTVARKTIRNEPKEWLSSLEWDGIPRLSNIFKDYFKSDQNKEYIESVSRNFLISIVARIFDPGCQVDTMPILYGKQGARKSTGLRALGGKFFATTKADPSDKDFFMVIRGKMLVELSELISFRSDKNEEIKDAISNPIDRFREPFGTADEVKDFKRTVVFAGTTNKKQYLNDETGARRFWPITVGDVDVSAIKTDRDQLFAEAVHCYNAGEQWWHINEDILASEHDKHTVVDELSEDIKHHLIGKSFVTISEIIGTVMGLDYKSSPQRSLSLRISKCLRSIGWEASDTTEWINGVSRKVFRPKSASFFIVDVEKDLPRVDVKAISEQKKLFNSATNQYENL